MRCSRLDTPRTWKLRLAAPVAESITLPVLGMTCASCQHHVETALQSATGVRSARVNLMANRATVTFDPESTTAGKLIDVIRSAGYDAVLPRTGGDSAGTSEAREGFRGQAAKALLTLLAGGLVMVAEMPFTPAGPTGSMTSLERAVRALAPWLYSAPAGRILWALLVITAGLVAWAGSGIYRSAWTALRHGKTNMNTMVSLGTGAAFVWSAAGRPVYFDAVLLIVGFLLLGKALEARAKTRASGALQALALLQPATARRVVDGVQMTVPLNEVQAGDSVAVLPGERFPVDAVVLEGRTTVDESMLTGESIPQLREAGDRVLAGSLNYEGAVTCRVESLGDTTTLAQIARMVEQAQGSRAPMDRLADRASSIFVPVVLGLAALTFIAWLVIERSLPVALANTVAILVVACPCAMGLAVPAALTVAVGRGAQMGILFKGGEALERLGVLDAIALDKTGTLTVGRPSLIGIWSVQPGEENNLLRLAASAEERSNHPLAHTVIDHAQMLGLTWQAAENVQVYPGRGLSATVESQPCLLGNEALLREFSVTLPEHVSPEEPGVTRLWMALDNRCAGYFDARDALRSDATRAVKLLRNLGAGRSDGSGRGSGLPMPLRVLMLTGDTAAAAMPIAAQAGISEVEAGLDPAAKLARIRALQAEGLRVAMIGDGINDAAALAQADVGIAMGSGTDLAQEAGDVILLRAHTSVVPDALGLARATLRVMRQNLGWAVGYNALGIPLAAGLFYPRFHILLTPWLASMAMALSSVCVLGNSLRLSRWKPTEPVSEP
jgi:Cu+-exporting ATPase